MFLVFYISLLELVLLGAGPLLLIEVDSNIEYKVDKISDYRRINSQIKYRV